MIGLIPQRKELWEVSQEGRQQLLNLHEEYVQYYTVDLLEIERCGALWTVRVIMKVGVANLGVHRRYSTQLYI